MHRAEWRAAFVYMCEVKIRYEACKQAAFLYI